MLISQETTFWEPLYLWNDILENAFNVITRPYIISDILPGENLRYWE